MSHAVITTLAFVCSLGVNTHLDFQQYGYQSLPVTEQAIRYLGLKNLRDDPEHPLDVGPNGWWQRVASATGAKFDAFMAEGPVAQMHTDLLRARELAGQGILSAIEGGNEEDDPYATSHGNSLAAAAAFQPIVYATAHSLGLPAINMSFGQGWTAANDWHGNYDKVGDLAPHADYANAHTYPDGPPRRSIERMVRNARLAAAGRPVVQTEFGYDTRVTNPREAARWTLDAALDAHAAGMVMTYFYALFDDGAGHFGLMNQDGSPKPAGAALHNLTSILTARANGAIQPVPIEYSLAGLPDSASTMLLRKNAATYDLLVWNEAGGLARVSVNVGGTVTVYDPVQSAAPISTGPRFQLGAEPIVLEISTREASADPSTAPTQATEAQSDMAPTSARQETRERVHTLPPCRE